MHVLPGEIPNSSCQPFQVAIGDSHVGLQVDRCGGGILLNRDPVAKYVERRAVGSLLNTMPTELPGFYWDEAKNRYFPISSRPKQALSPPPHTAQKDTDSSKDVIGRRQCLPWSRNETIRITNNYTQRQRASQ